MPTPNSAHIENTNFTPLRKKLITGDQWIKTREKVTKNKIKKLKKSCIVWIITLSKNNVLFLSIIPFKISEEHQI